MIRTIIRTIRKVVAEVWQLGLSIKNLILSTVLLKEKKQKIEEKQINEKEQIKEKEGINEKKNNKNIITYILKEVILGINHANNLPTLPVKLDNFHNNLIIRIIRLIFGIITVLYFMSINNPNINKLILNNIPKEIILIIVIIHMMYFTFILAVKTKTIRKLIKDKKYEIRNSPLRMVASASGKLYLCFKGICTGLITTGGTLAFFSGIDGTLENIGRKKVFTPILEKYTDITLEKLGWSKEKKDISDILKEYEILVEEGKKLEEVQLDLEVLKKVIESNNWENEFMRTVENDLKIEIEEHKEEIKKASKIIKENMIIVLKK